MLLKLCPGFALESSYSQIAVMVFSCSQSPSSGAFNLCFIFAIAHIKHIFRTSFAIPAASPIPTTYAFVKSVDDSFLRLAAVRHLWQLSPYLIIITSTLFGYNTKDAGRLIDQGPTFNNLCPKFQKSADLSNLKFVNSIKSAIIWFELRLVRATRLKISHL